MALFVDHGVIMSSGKDYESQALSRVELEHVPRKITQAWADSQSQQRQHKPHPVSRGCLPEKNREKIDRWFQKEERHVQRATLIALINVTKAW